MNAGGLLLILLGIFLLLEFFAGRLEWLFHLGDQVTGAITTTIAKPPFPTAFPGVAA